MSDGGFWQVRVYTAAGALVDLPSADIESIDVTDAMNGGSGTGTIQFKRGFNSVGAIAYGYQVLIWVWGPGETQPTDPWYAGFIQDIDQEQQSASGLVTAHLQGNMTLLDAAIVTEQTNPSIGTNPSLDAGAYVAHLLSTYQPTSFGSPTIPGTTFNMFPTNFDGTKLGAAIDTVIKQGQDLTGLIFAWYVRTKADLTKKVIVQVDQNPNVVGGVKFIHLFLQSQIDQYKIATKYRDIINVVAVYGAKDPTTGQQVYGVFEDATSVAQFGPLEDKISVPALTTAAGCQSYATTWLTLNAYPQAQGTFRILQPTYKVQAGTWVQIWETPAVIKQVRCAQVNLKISGERIDLYVSTTSPVPYLDDAVYRMGMNAGTSQAIVNTPLAVNKQALFIRAGATLVTTASSPAKVQLTGAEAVFPTVGIVYVSPLALTQLTDNSGGVNNGQTGDGAYTVSVNTAGSWIITKGPRPQNSATQQNVLTAVVISGVPYTADCRTLNGQPAFPTLPAPTLASGHPTVTLGTPVNAGSGAYDQPTDFWLDPATWTNANPQLAYFELGAVPAGQPQPTASIAPLQPNATGHYTPTIPALGGGTAYDLYVRAHDNLDRNTPWLALGTTNPNPVDASGLASIPATGTPSAATAPTISSAALGAVNDQGAAGWKQSVSAAWADWSVGSVPGWVAGSRFYTRTHGGTAVVAAGDRGVQQISNAILGTVTLPAGVICDIGISLFDLASGAETPIAWPAAWSNILAAQITSTTLDILAQLKLVEPDYVISGGDVTSTGNGWDVGTWDSVPWDF